MSLEDVNKKKPNPILKKIKNQMKPKRGSDLARARARKEAGGYAVSVKMPKAIESLLEQITDEDIARVAQSWRDALDATTMTYDIIEKKYIERPDHNTRMKAGQLIAAYREGLPVARQVQLNGKFTDLSELLAAAKASPATMKKLAEMGHVIEVETEIQETGQCSTPDFPSEDGG